MLQVSAGPLHWGFLRTHSTQHTATFRMVAKAEVNHGCMYISTFALTSRADPLGRHPHSHSLTRGSHPMHAMLQQVQD